MPACSALERACRDRIRADAPPTLGFVFLDVAADEATHRFCERSGHVVPPRLMGRHFRTPERPGRDEADVLTVAAGRRVHDVVDANSGRSAAGTDFGARRHD